ncbi:Auxin-responsive protein IAA32 [Striga hermonthica]|uniref:Auxin-responsive protein n=1 Tax=Striga hermonthica TaxID=68872 RepID=A0A9N7NVF4_STRHE|nr:Auxin-responsive protein IAA32 [Striga hermonthica]
MDSNASSYILNQAEYYLSKEDSDILDLGLSLRTLQPDQACYPSPHENCELLVDWHHRFKRTTNLNPQMVMKESGRDGEESEGIQSKQRWMSYVKVNMDGVIVGRKICILESMNYSSLALRLEEMFGKQSSSGLRLFEAESRFSLVYKDKDGQWRNVGDVPWMEFVDRVKRLRIACKDQYDLKAS